jgi:hypothetical protein
MGRFGRGSHRLVMAIALCAAAFSAHAQGGAGTVVYRCPGNVYTSERDISPKQAEDKGCKVLEGTPLTVIQGPRPRTAAAAPSAAAAPAPRGSDAKVDAAQQRARDSDAKRILEEELRKEEERLAAMQKEYNGGEPERKGDERNYQRYIDRVAEMKAALARKEGDIAAIKRELSKIAQ